MIQNDVLGNAHDEGHAEGLAEGLAKGRAEGRAEGREQGRAEGIEQGKEQGANEEKRRLAKMMLDMGESMDKIAAYTGLTREMIEKLSQ